MADMSVSAPAVDGFSVYQPALGSPLQFLPAVGTKELDQLIAAYVPGSASTSEKRATISMDFFKYSRQTGQNFKYYAVITPAATPESAHNVSPVMSDLGFYSSSSQVSTPAFAPAPKERPSVHSRKPAKTKPAAPATDFSHLPGMKILTADGQDVTNTVSRGCKSKEQRDHAHLMRILKACDACKKKKIRCDPSHKKRPASQLESQPEAARPARKTRKTTASTPKEQSTAFTPAPATFFQVDGLGLGSADFLASIDEPWDQFLTFNDEPVDASIPQDFYGAVPQGFDFFCGVDNSFSPNTSGSSVSSTQPLTPVNSGLLPQATAFTISDDNSFVFLQNAANGQEPTLPYLHQVGQPGSNYVDFNLYSPASSFIDEEPQVLKSAPTSVVQSPVDLNGRSQSSTGLARGHQSRFDQCQSQSRSALSPSDSEQRVPGATQHTRCAGELVGTLPYFANDAGHSPAHSAATVTRPQGLQNTRSRQPLPGESVFERSGLSSQSSISMAPASPLSPTASSRASRQDTVQLGSDNASLGLQTVSPTEMRHLDSGRRPSGLSSSETAPQSLLTSPTAVVASISTSTGTGSPGPQKGISAPVSGTSQGDLSAGLSQFGHELRGPSPAAVVTDTGLGHTSLSNSVKRSYLPRSGSGSVAVRQEQQQRGLGSTNAIAPISRQDLGLPSQGLVQSPTATSKQACLPSSVDSAPLFSPARQSLVASRSPRVPLLPQLAASGLVSAITSLALMMVLVVVFVSTLQRHQEQEQTPAESLTQALNISANLPSVSTVILALLAAAAPASTAALPCKTTRGVFCSAVALLRTRC